MRLKNAFQIDCWVLALPPLPSSHEQPCDPAVARIRHTSGERGREREREGVKKKGRERERKRESERERERERESERERERDQYTLNLEPTRAAKMLKPQ